MVILTLKLLLLFYNLTRLLQSLCIHMQKGIRNWAMIICCRFSPQPRYPQPIRRKPKSWKTLLEEAQRRGEKIEPVKHRKEIPQNLCCPRCKAPYQYLYNYTFDPSCKLQKIRCKICGFQTVPQRPKRSPRFFCPFCGKALEKVKSNPSFQTYKCRNKSCPYRTDPSIRKKAIAQGASKIARSYIFKIPNFDLQSLQISAGEIGKVDLCLCRYPPSIVILCLIFYIQMGLSLRETSFNIEGLFGIRISHQTIYNWVVCMAQMLHPLVENIISDAEVLVCDESFIKICGENGYWCVSFDPESKVLILSLLSQSRDTSTICTLMKGTKQRSQKLRLIVTDAFRAYSTAVYLLYQEGIEVNQVVVKGLSYRGVWQDLFLPLKLMIERMFRTFKQRYRRTHGFATHKGGWAYCTLFVVYYNFLRPHSSLSGKAPLGDLCEGENFFKKWDRLIKMAISQG